MKSDKSQRNPRNTRGIMGNGKNMSGGGGMKGHGSKK